MDYNRASADTEYGRSEGSSGTYNDTDMFKEAMKNADSKLLSSRRTKKTITIVLLSVLLIIITVCVALIDTSEDNERAAARKAEQAVTERPKITIPEISMPKVTVPHIDIPSVKQDILDALNKDKKAMQEFERSCMAFFFAFRRSCESPGGRC